jgi:dihydroxy-acid dehydratase
VVHLLALAGRIGVPLSLQDFDEIGREAPLLVNLMPSGKYLMEDFCYAGGVPAVMNELGPRLRRDAVTVAGVTLGEIADSGQVWNREVIGTVEAPIGPSSGVWVLSGNLCPQGAILKPSAATPSLLTHTGKAVVFETIEDYHARIDHPDLEVDATSILVLKGCGPKGYPGMPEVGNMGLPPKILATGVTDMVRISDARMSGTAYGTVILHVAPEAEMGGPLALVRNGDEIAFDGPNRSLTLLVDEAELARRRTAWEAARQPSKYDRGWYRLYIDTVLQADQGADLDFLVGKSSADVSRESH